MSKRVKITNTNSESPESSDKDLVTKGFLKSYLKDEFVKFRVLIKQDTNEAINTAIDSLRTELCLHIREVADGQLSMFEASTQRYIGALHEEYQGQLTMVAEGIMALGRRVDRIEKVIKIH